MPEGSKGMENYANAEKEGGSIFYEDKTNH